MKYKYVGNGLGVPGLPHAITDKEADELGVSDLLLAALTNGNYSEVSKDAETTEDVNDG